ncbi:MAG TPA: hypothetical protein VFK52_00360 [Nocardioidaceae bacterium]|nr:hypothetical protein [Nocardioidaceae bacterium]
MVTKKRRRSQLAHAAAERQAVRRAAREHKRQTRQKVLTVVLVVVLLGALTAWILTHRRDSGAALGSAGYAGASATTSDPGVTR